jgi:hypothetical protein
MKYGMLKFRLQDILDAQYTTGVLQCSQYICSIRHENGAPQRTCVINASYLWLSITERLHGMMTIQESVTESSLRTQ